MSQILGMLAVSTVVAAALGAQATLVQALASLPETGFNTHLRGTLLTPGDFMADVDDMVNHQLKWVRLNILEDVASPGGTSTNPQLVWNKNALAEYDNAISYAFSKGLKIYLVTNTPSFAQNSASDVYLSITFQYHQFLASRYQGKIAVWQVFNEADLHNFKNYSTITGFDAAYLASLSSAMRAAASAIKQVNPGIRIAANVGGYPPDSALFASWQQYFAGLVNNIDVIAVDLYPGTYDDIHKFPAVIQSLKSQFGKAIIVSETGMCTGLHSDQTQAAIISMTIATLQLAPVDAIIVYEVRDENTGALTGVDGCENTLGIKRTDGTQKPAYGEVMRALNELPSSPSPAVVSWGFNRIDAFMPGEYSNLWHLAWNGSPPAGWQSLGGALTSLPAVVSWGPNRIDAFARGLDSSLQHLAWNGSNWTGWQSLGGVLTSLPVAVSWGPNRIDAFAVGTDNGLWHIAWNGSTWTGWESLGGDPSSPPAVVSWGPNRLDIFIRGNDYGLWHKAWNGNVWSSWESLGGIVTSAPAAVSWGAGRLDVFAAGQDRELLHQFWNGSVWSGWESLGGMLSSPPGAVSWGPNRIDVFAEGRLFAQGQQNELLHQYWNGSTWGGWESQGTCSGYTSVLASNAAMPPGACIWADNGSTALWMQFDGNLCVYNAQSNWCANTGMEAQTTGP